MKKRLLINLSSLPALAQLPAPNAIFSFHDIDAANKFRTALSSGR